MSRAAKRSRASLSTVLAGLLLGSRFLGCSGQPDASSSGGEDLGSEATKTCAHDVLCTGSALPSSTSKSGCTTASGANGYCVPEVCAALPGCCSTAWTNECVQEMEKFTTAGGSKYNDCPSPTADPAPACSPAGDGGAADSGTGKDAGSPDAGKKDAGSGDSGTSTDAGSSDAGAPPSGSVGASGGTLSALRFAVVGDTRPATIDDTAGYPTSVITQIFTDVANASPPIPFGVSTGDYQYASTDKTTGAAQISIYLGARASYSHVMFPAMGNHECNGYTASNCGTGNVDGVTNNYTAFLDQMLGPIAQTLPYYAIPVNAIDGSWTAKFLIVAGNAWSSAQATWLTSEMVRPTTYTFIVRHEAKSASTAPGVNPSEAIMAKYPYTLAIVGHTHTYEKSGAREVIIGNGGAPLTSSVNYGYGLLNQRSDGAIQVDMIDYQTGQPDLSFRFAVNADGSPAAAD